MKKSPHLISVDEVLKELESGIEGLSAREAEARLAKYGPNELKETVSRPPWKMLLAQFIEPMILILEAAAILSFVLGNPTEGMAILAIVILFGILGFLQEYRAEKAMAALKQMSCPVVRVRRDGELQELPAHGLVPGDVVVLEAGNVVPADLRLLECIQLGVLEAALTGESEAVHKHTEALTDAECPLGDRANQAWMGTLVARGRAEGIVVRTGMETELGKIAGLIQEMDEGRTPLQKKLAQVGKHLSLAGMVAAAAIFVLGLSMGSGIGETLLTAVSLLVAVVPEGLPAVITATLALGGRRMLKRNALIRKLPAVETLGAVTVICTDKTGTLTENRMTVLHLQTLHHRLELPAEWTGTMDLGAMSRDTADETAPLLFSAALCNDGHLVREEAGQAPHGIGDPTETALLVAAERFGIATASLHSEMPRTGEYAFDSRRKRMTTLHRGDHGDYPLPALLEAPVLAAVKGSPDGLLTCCTHVLDAGRIRPMDDATREKFLAENAAMASAGIRVLGMAFRRFETAPVAEAPVTDIECQLVFCGLAGLMDPPRQAVRGAIASSHSAGIRTVMITGDHPLTAGAIARHLGIAGSREPAVLTGDQVSALTPEELEAAAAHTDVYARVSPEDKLNIVAALQARGQIVAMTGDGVNDSPALKKADIGVAMGRTGTDVAKESSKMVLLDDNYATLVAAVEEGRTIYDNLVRFIKYSFGGNLGKVLVMLMAPALGLGAIALRPLHLLWLNLMTDGLMGLGLGLEAAETNVMQRPPRNPAAPILDKQTIGHVSWMGLFICAGSLALAWVWHHLDQATGTAPLWQSVLFSGIGFAQIGQAWGLRSYSGKPFRFLRNRALEGLTLVTLAMQLGVMYFPPAARAFQLQPLPAAPLAATAGLGVVTFLLVHGERCIRARRAASREAAASATASAMPSA